MQQKSMKSNIYKRSPIVTVLGHIDTGKTSLLDKIRGTAVQKREAGGITQHIGASFFPIETIESICGELLKELKIKLTLPGLLIIDTPGHEVFYNLRRRGGSVSDIAILVLDILKGFQAQTYECISILRSRKTPFVVAANKLDKIPGWQAKPNLPFIKSYKMQSPTTRRHLDDAIYKMIGEFSQEGFSAERFDKIKDFTKYVAIVPTSAVTGEGIPELLMILSGLVQHYMQKRLETTLGPGKGVVLEVKEEVGLGRTLDVILYDGIIRQGDTIIIGGIKKPIITKVRSLLQPKPLDEIRDPREKFFKIKEITAAAGIKIAAPNLEETVAGSSLRVVWDESNIAEIEKEIKEELTKIRITTDKLGVIAKADTLGSLEAIIDYFQRFGVPIRIADVGDVSKRDIIEAAAVKESNPYYGVVLAFNVKVLPDAQQKAKELDVMIFKSDIIYHLFEDYDAWVKEKKEEELKIKSESVIHPGKIKVLPNYIFRKSKPAIVGVEVMSGIIKPLYSLMNEKGKIVGEIMQIQDKGKTIQTANLGMAVAISIKGATVGRDFDPGDILYVHVPIEHIRVLEKDLKEILSPDEISTLDEIKKIRRKRLIG